MKNPQQMRDENLAFLNERGFHPATWMPLPAAVGEVAEESGFAGGTLRGEAEIAARFFCHFATFAWGSAPPEFEPAILAFVSDNRLRPEMTNDERQILQLNKNDAAEQYADIVGWRLENMWSLAWILGVLEEPSATTGQIGDDVSSKMMSLFIPNFDISVPRLLQMGQTQPIEQIVLMEDRFYLAHNAVRSGQLGKTELLPPDFDPIADGGAIHERRHSLTWALAPGSSWNDTDLST